jgi:hypothetical protein
MAKFPLYPKNPERICWGCEKLCPADDMCCGNGTIRCPHPCELMGNDWYEWLEKREAPEPEAAADSPAGQTRISHTVSSRGA